MAFKVGDRVVYPHHGAAIIERTEKRDLDGEKVEYLVLRMAHGELTLSVPNGTAVYVRDRRGIKYEWSDGKIEKSVDQD